MTPRRRHSSERGFTLVEMMTVVVLVGVLATLAVYGVRKYILSAKSGEAVSMMTSIKTAEEAFKDETFVYLDVSTNFQPANWYPTATPGRTKVQWGGGTAALADKWRALGVHPAGPTYFSYAVVATPPGGAVPDLPTVVKHNSDFNLPTTASDWMYVACGRADLGGVDGVYTVVMSHSLSTDIYVENEGE
ncbi:MAG TPA: prepilin-type N-terminal cleavage/methylation domain-containing protein [Polyangiaceae bacterium]|nr:prepilin-type N-terminal cleavage/methylation domain-containing protein [Polyangiaceae bacterium]